MRALNHAHMYPTTDNRDGITGKDFCFSIRSCEGNMTKVSRPLFDLSRIKASTRTRITGHHELRGGET
jgi:hypothetical protein